MWLYKQLNIFQADSLRLHNYFRLHISRSHLSVYGMSLGIQFLGWRGRISNANLLRASTEWGRNWEWLLGHDKIW